MGNTLTVLTTIVALIQVATYATCVGPTDEKSEDCDRFTKPDECVAHVTTGGNCRWIPQEKALPFSASAVTTEGGRLRKDLIPVEAETEYIGDVVYYNVLLHKMHRQFKDILPSSISATGYSIVIDQSELKVAKSPHKIMKDAMPHLLWNTQISSALSSKEERSPVQTLLQYSRPFFKTIPYEQTLITSDTFTVGNAITIAMVAWMDALSMNDDRFMLGAPWSHINTGNMMLYEHDVKGHKRYEYVPIDQGFARIVYANWYKTKYKTTDEYWVEKEDFKNEWPDQQLFWSELGLSEKVSSVTKMWLDWYNDFIDMMIDPIQSASFALDFVDDNRVYFPTDMKTIDKFETKIMVIMHAVWHAIGAEIISHMESEFKRIGDAITRTIESPGLLGVKPTKPAKSMAARAGRAMKKALSSTPAELVPLNRYKWQWKKVKQAIQNMFKTGSRFKEHAFADEVKGFETSFERKCDVLVKDLIGKKKKTSAKPKTKATTKTKTKAKAKAKATTKTKAKAKAKAHIDYYDTYQESDGYYKQHKSDKLGKTVSVARLYPMKSMVHTGLIHAKTKGKASVVGLRSSTKRDYDQVQKVRYDGYDGYDDGYDDVSYSNDKYEYYEDIVRAAYLKGYKNGLVSRLNQ